MTRASDGASGMTTEQGSPTTEAGQALLGELVPPDEHAQTCDACRYIDHQERAEQAKAIAAIEAEARKQALTDAIAAVEGLTDNEWRECGGACHDHTLAAVIDTLTRLRDTR